MRPSPWGLVLVLAASCTAGDDLPAPLLSTLMPDHGPPGTSVSLQGDYFCQQQETGIEDPLACAFTGIVTFGTAPGAVQAYGEHAIVVEVPSLEPGTYAVEVAVAGRRSNSRNFVVDGL